MEPASPANGAASALGRDVLHHGASERADERDRHRMGADAVARDAAGGVGGAEEAP